MAEVARDSGRRMKYANTRSSSLSPALCPLILQFLPPPFLLISVLQYHCSLNLSLCPSILFSLSKSLISPLYFPLCPSRYRLIYISPVSFLPSTYPFLCPSFSSRSFLLPVLFFCLPDTFILTPSLVSCIIFFCLILPLVFFFPFVLSHFPPYSVYPFLYLPFLLLSCKLCCCISPVSLHNFSSMLFWFLSLLVLCSFVFPPYFFLHALMVFLLVLCSFVFSPSFFLHALMVSVLVLCSFGFYPYIFLLALMVSP